VGDRADIVTPYGFSGPTSNVECPEFPHLWREFAVQQGWICGYLAMHPLLERSDLYGPDDVCRHTELYLLELRDAVSALSHLAENRRRELRAWAARPEEVVTDRNVLTEFILREQARFFASRGATDTYRLSDATWRALLAARNVIALGAAEGSRVVAASVFGYTAVAGEFLFNVSLPEGRRFSAALIWEGGRALQRQGVTLLNLGGGVRPGDGVAQFKRRFGPTVRWARSLCQVYDRNVYERYCRDRGVEPERGHGYFPPYREIRSQPGDGTAGGGNERVR
jgi:hypothetical protein